MNPLLFNSSSSGMDQAEQRSSWCQWRSLCVGSRPLVWILNAVKISNWFLFTVEFMKRSDSAWLFQHPEKTR